MTRICPGCGGEFSQIGQHWAMSSCDHPKMSEKQKDTLRGLLMGDGNIPVTQERKNYYLIVKMISKPYLKHLSDVCFPVLSNEVRLEQTAAESARGARKSGFSPGADPEDYSDIFALGITAHPWINNLTDWYSTGEKVFPPELELTPTVLKHWYCCDGSLDRSDNSPIAEISLCNEEGNKEKIKEIFCSVGFKNLKWCVNERKRRSGRRVKVRFNREETKDLFGYMGSPPPGFRYKWE